MAIVAGDRTKFALAPNFRAFLRNIRPPKERRDAAKKYPTLVRDFLGRTNLLITREPHSRLVGSYGKHIAIHEIKDVDIAIFLDEIYAELGPLRALEDLRVALEAFADELEEELRERPEVELREQRRSVRVHFKSDDFFLDVVPVRAPEGTDGVLLVPDREWKNWQFTACVALLHRVEDLNQDVCDELLVPLLKIVKHWRSKWLRRNQAKSFWVEAMILNLIIRNALAFSGRSLAEVVTDAFAAIREECTPYLAIEGATPVVPDPMIPDLNPNVAFNWKRGDFETFMRRIEEACAWTEAAIAAETAKDAIVEWQRLFGEEWFPAEIEDEAKAAKAAVFDNKIGVGAGGAVFITRVPESTPVVRPRFNVNHGDEDE